MLRRELPTQVVPNSPELRGGACLDKTNQAFAQRNQFGSAYSVFFGRKLARRPVSIASNKCRDRHVYQNPSGQPAVNLAVIMKAIRIHECGDAGTLKLEEVPRLSIKDDEILVQIQDAGVNPIDWKSGRAT
jgi:hypothetical protein